MNELEIVDEADESDAEYLVCPRLTRPLIMPDNRIDLCCKCGEALQHRPHVPKGPQLICIVCIEPSAIRDAERGNLHLSITTKTAFEIANHIRKQRTN